MAPSGHLVVLLQLLSWISAGSACFCERYPWGSWSACSRSCNHGIQHRNRVFQYDKYFWRASCLQMCKGDDSRVCNEQTCPINCLLTDYGPWSECSPCAQKQFRTRFVQRPSQFKGAPCSPELTEERTCYPTAECKLPPTDCKDDFKCDNRRCINSTLTCNNQNDCGDNSDEKDCVNFKVVCPVDKRVAPGTDLVGNGFDGLAEAPRGVVLDNMFMGGSCDLKRPPSTLLLFRIPHNFESFNIKVGELEDFNTEPHPLNTESIDLKKSSSSQSSNSNQNNLFIPIIFLPMFFFGGTSMTSFKSNKHIFDASKKSDSKFIRVNQVLPVSTFKMKEAKDLVLSNDFLQYLYALPLDYNYALYREIFQRFGTHYYASGSLGGHYDLVYQYSREELKSSDVTEEHVTGCLNRETTFTVILYSQHSRVSRCSDDRMSEKYEGSYIKSAEKSFSMVRGGRPREASALAWERQGSAPDRIAYKNWAKSVMDNPAVVESKVLSIIDLVHGIPCAVTKRRHLRRALLQYSDEFDTCKCAPCPNNARPVLSGTECKCVCQTGTFGDDCEKRAPDFTSEAVDGYWSCWGLWSSCGSSMKRHRTRRCNNPAPLRGGQDCNGAAREEEPCHISIFQTEETCDNDDDFTVGWINELPPGVEGCLRPKAPPNSFLRKGKQYYSFGEDEEFQCYTGFDLDGFQFINCLPDGTWNQPGGRCIRKICLPPEIPDGMSLYPNKNEYRVEESVGVTCNDAELLPLPRGFYKCGESLTWEPPLPTNLRCTADDPYVPDIQCRPGETLQNSQCVCFPRESCNAQPENLCVLNVEIGAIVPMSSCALLAGRCHGDPLLFVAEGSCDTVDSNRVEWAKFRAKMAPQSSIQESCESDICYEWETCSEFKKCECKAARDCPRVGTRMFCVRLTRNQRTLNMALCTMAAFKCSSHDFEILNEGACPPESSS